MMTVFLIIIALALLVMIVLVMLPKKLDFINGYPATLSTEEPRNLLGEVQEVLGPRDREVTFTEAEVNTYINERIKGKQGGPVSVFVNFKGVYADFEKGRAEFFIERSVAGIPFTMSLRLTKKKVGSKTVWRAGGGSIGRFSMSSRQFKPIIDAFTRLSVALEEEMSAVKMMTDVRFEDDKVVLDPNY